MKRNPLNKNSPNWEKIVEEATTEDGEWGICGKPFAETFSDKSKKTEEGLKVTRRTEKGRRGRKIEALQG